MDSHLLVVSGVSSCRRSGRSEAEMNPGETVATGRVASQKTATIPKAIDGHRRYDQTRQATTGYQFSRVVELPYLQT